MNTLTYVLVTPARDEESFIELTIRSVVQQTVRPLKWIIVSDGSTDRTDEIVGQYAQQHDWIELLRMPDRGGRHFGGKVNCFNEGWARLKSLRYDVIGSLDADLSFDANYFEFLLEKLADDPTLGLVGTPFAEDGQTYDYRFSSKEHVSGACQVFRRECFEAIGGYVPLKGGGIDDVAVVTAKMRGWRVETFTELASKHHRPMGSANSGRKVTVSFNAGQRAYRLGWHPLWQLFRSTYQMTRKPYVLGGAALLAGYVHASLSRTDRMVSKELIDFQRQDQLKRLRAFFRIDSKSSRGRA